MGKKKTTGIAVSSVIDKGKSIIRLDGLQRLNAGATIGEFVSIKLAKVYAAEEIIFTPTKANLDLRKQGAAIKAKLIDKPLVIGDIIEVLGEVYQTNDSDNTMNEIMKMMPMLRNQKRKPVLGTLRLIVEDSIPSDKVVKITRDTRIKVNKRVAVLNVSGGVVTYDDIGGLKKEIKKIQQVINLFMENPELFLRFGLTPINGVLFHGPPGTGKTLLARAISQQTPAYFINVDTKDIVNIYDEKKLKRTFEEATLNSPSIIFIDQIDAIAPKVAILEHNLKAHLMALLDGFNPRKDVLVIGETNRIDLVDPALRRPGRFDLEIEFRVPSKEERYEILKIHTRLVPMDKSVDLRVIAEMTEGYVGADIALLIKVSIYSILEEMNYDPSDQNMINEITLRMENLLETIKSIKPTLSKS